MQRLQDAALALKPIGLMTGSSKETNEAKKNQSERETFFFERFYRFLAH
jgi:hypothetical protein